MPAVVNLASEAAEHGLEITLSRGQSVAMQTGAIRSCWYIEVSAQRTTDSGRRGKPSLLMRVVASEDQTPVDLLKMLVAAYEQGDVRIDR